MLLLGAASKLRPWDCILLCTLNHSFWNPYPLILYLLLPQSRVYRQLNTAAAWFCSYFLFLTGELAARASACHGFCFFSPWGGVFSTSAASLFDTAFSKLAECVPNPFRLILRWDNAGYIVPHSIKKPAGWIEIMQTIEKFREVHPPR